MPGWHACPRCVQTLLIHGCRHTPQPKAGSQALHYADPAAAGLPDRLHALQPHRVRTAPPPPLLRLNDAAAGGQGNALQLVLGLWTERFIEFQGAYHIKLSVSALALLLATRHPALAAAQVRKQGLASMWAGTLSCPSMCYAVML